MKILNDEKMYSNDYKNIINEINKDYNALVILHNGYLGLYVSIINNPVANIIYQRYKESLNLKEDEDEPKIYLINRTIEELLKIMSGDPGAWSLDELLKENVLNKDIERNNNEINIFRTN